MESYVDEIIQEWYTKLRELDEIKQNIKAEGLLLKDLRIRFMFIKKYFENKAKIFSKKQKNFLNVKSSSLTALNLMKEKEMMKIKKAYKEIIELEKIEDPFKPKQEKIRKTEVDLEEKLRVIKRPKEKRDDSEKEVSERSDNERRNVRKVEIEKIVKDKVDTEKVYNEKEVSERGDNDKSVDKERRNDRVVVDENVVKEKIVTFGFTNKIKLLKQPVEDLKPIEKVKEPIDKNDNPVKLNKIEVKNKMKSLLNAFQSKSQKNGDQNKENIPDRSILVEDGEVKLFIVNKKKRVKDYLKETKRKKNKVKCDDNDEEVASKEKVNKENSPPKEVSLFEDANVMKEANLIKDNTPKEPSLLKEASPFKEPNPPKEPTFIKDHNPTINKPTINKPINIFDRTSELIKKRILKNKTPEKVYDVGTNRFISESNLKNVNLKNLCRSPLKDGLYKNIIDKERKSKSRIGMNKFIPKTPVPEINSDEEENYSGLITEKEISEKLKNQNHEEIEKYFNSELSIDIELLFPSIKEVSNESPNKWG